MLEEIFEEPRVVDETLIKNQKTVKKIVAEIRAKKYERIYITGSGTSYHAGLACQYAMLNLEKTLTSLIPASEFSLWVPSTMDQKTLVIAISQSGENLDILNAVSASLDRQMDVLAVTNTSGSTLSTKSHYTLLTHAGKEMAVTATRDYIAQLAILFLLSLELANKPKNDELLFLKQKLFESAILIQKAITSSDAIMQKMARNHKDESSSYVR